MFMREFAIDLGTSMVRIAVRGRGVVLEEPTLAAVDRSSGQVLAVGREAEALLAQSAGQAVALRPVQGGVIADPVAAARMLRLFLRKLQSGSPVRPDALLCLPGYATAVEVRAATEVLSQAGVRRVRTMEMVRAAALGAGLEPGRPLGSMVVDIGHAGCHAAVFAVGAIQEQQFRRFGANAWDAALQRHLRRAHGMLLGSRMAEALRHEMREGEACRIAGRQLTTGQPLEVTLSPEEWAAAWAPAFEELADMAALTLMRMPRVLLPDLETQGILLTGGGSQIPGLAAGLEHALSLPVRCAEDAPRAVIRGAAGQLAHSGVRARQTTRRLLPA